MIIAILSTGLIDLPSASSGVRRSASGYYFRIGIRGKDRGVSLDIRDPHSTDANLPDGE
jgi:hypothetical protein